MEKAFIIEHPDVNLDPLVSEQALSGVLNAGDSKQAAEYALDVKVAKFRQDIFLHFSPVSDNEGAASQSYRRAMPCAVFLQGKFRFRVWSPWQYKHKAPWILSPCTLLVCAHQGYGISNGE